MRIRKADKEGLLIHAENYCVNNLFDTDIRMVLVCYQQIQFNFAYKKEQVISSSNWYLHTFVISHHSGSSRWSPQNNLHPFCEQFKFAESHCLKVLLLLSLKFADKILSESVLLLLLLICDAGFDSSWAIFNPLLAFIQRKY